MKDYVIALDPSGNFTEGKGTTGYAIAVDSYIYAAGQIYAAEYPTQMEYWTEVLKLILKTKEENSVNSFHVVCEDYRLYASRSESQINSNLETPQFIGAIKWFCYMNHIPITMQMAVEVKDRWSDDVLQAKGLLKKNGNKYKLGCLNLNNHSLDAVRHLIHYLTFKSRVRTSEIAKKPRIKESSYYD